MNKTTIDQEPNQSEKNQVNHIVNKYTRQIQIDLNKLTSDFNLFQDELDRELRSSSKPKIKELHRNLLKLVISLKQGHQGLLNCLVLVERISKRFLTY